MRDQIIYNTLIGKDVVVNSSTNKLNLGICGKIVFETKNLFHILTKKKDIKKVVKKDSSFIINICDKKVQVKGFEIENTLINRIKRLKK